MQINLGTGAISAVRTVISRAHLTEPPWTVRQLDKSLAKLLTLPVQRIEFTGGAPELNPSLPVFIQRLSTDAVHVTVRTNLTVLALAEYAAFLNSTKLIK